MVKPVFHSLPVVDLETLSISTLELFVTIANSFQSLIIVVKISVEFLNLQMGYKSISTVSIFYKF